MEGMLLFTRDEDHRKCVSKGGTGDIRQHRYNISQMPSLRHPRRAQKVWSLHHDAQFNAIKRVRGFTLTEHKSIFYYSTTVYHCVPISAAFITAFQDSELSFLCPACQKVCVALYDGLYVHMNRLYITFPINHLKLGIIWRNNLIFSYVQL